MMIRPDAGCVVLAVVLKNFALFRFKNLHWVRLTKVDFDYIFIHY